VGRMECSASRNRELVVQKCCTLYPARAPCRPHHEAVFLAGARYAEDKTSIRWELLSIPSASGPVHQFSTISLRRELALGTLQPGLQCISFTKEPMSRNE